MDNHIIKQAAEAAFLHTPAWEPFKGEEWGERWEKACTEFWNSAIEAAAKEAEQPVLTCCGKWEGYPVPDGESECCGQPDVEERSPEQIAVAIRTLKGT